MYAGTRRKFASKKKVTVELLHSAGTGIKLPDSSVELVSLLHVFHEVQDEPAALKEFLRILKPSGRLLITERTRSDRMPPAKFGPPIVDDMGIVQQIKQAGLSSLKRFRMGRIP